MDKLEISMDSHVAVRQTILHKIERYQRFEQPYLEARKLRESFLNLTHLIQVALHENDRSLELCGFILIS